MNSISFQGKTTLVMDPKKLKESENILRRNYGYFRNSSNRLCKNQFYDSCNRTIISGNLYCIKPDNKNIGLIVHNPNNASGFMKYIPINKDSSEQLFEILNNTEKMLKKSKEKLTAWIIGGDSINNILGDKTIKVLNEIADILCDRPNIDTSILVGTKKGAENVLVHANKSKFDITLEAKKNTNLEDLFDIVELNNTEII